MPPYLDFNCLLIYLTPSGYRRQFRNKVRAFAADLALAIAEHQLRTDSRRKIAEIIYSEAVQA